ncbi:MAG: folate family ECF transporter S component [Lachnospiraceae bacterium]|nr:folate family ECF transporter S component [Lachnospiraceae bacterium]
MSNNVSNKGLTDNSRESFFGVFSGSISASERIRTICIMGVLIAVYVILERWVAIPIGNILRFSFTFIILYTSAVMLGLLNTVVVVVLSDVIGSFIAGYAPNPFITLCLVLSAVVVSLLVYKKRTVTKYVIAVLFDQLISCLLIKSFVLAVMYYGKDQYFKVLASRAVQIGIMIPLQIVILLALDKFFFPRLKEIIEK